MIDCLANWQSPLCHTVQLLHYDLRDYGYSCVSSDCSLGEVERLRRELGSSMDKSDQQRESLQQRLMQADKDHQMALRNEKQSHDEDLRRLIQEMVRMAYRLLLHLSICLSASVCLCGCLLDSAFVCLLLLYVSAIISFWLHSFSRYGALRLEGCLSHIRLH